MDKGYKEIKEKRKSDTTSKICGVIVIIIVEYLSTTSFSSKHFKTPNIIKNIRKITINIIKPMNYAFEQSLL